MTPEVEVEPCKNIEISENEGKTAVRAKQEQSERGGEAAKAVVWKSQEERVWG